MTASLVEIREKWTLYDLLDAHRALDLRDELQRLAEKKATTPKD